MKHLFRVMIALMAGAWFAAAGANEPVKVVYHINEGNEQASNGLRNIRNHLDADPTAKIVVVTHSKGIDFLLEGAKDANGNPYDAMVQTLKARNVEFRVCRNTLTGRKLPDTVVIPDASIVPSGVAEVARLQAKERFVYLRP